MCAVADLLPGGPSELVLGRRAALGSRLARAVRLGLKGLWMHRLRSLLTVLGIVFGVCSVIAMLAIGEGASYEAQLQIKNLGSQNIILRSHKPPEEEKISDRGSQSYVLQYGITYRDAQRIQSTIPGVMTVLPGRVMREYVRHHYRRVDAEIMATVPWYPAMRNERVQRGRFFNARDMAECANVCVVAAETVPTLFPLDSPLGQHVRVGGSYYQVIGVMEPRGQGAAQTLPGGAKPAAHRLFIPIETARTRYGEILRKIRSGSFEQEKVQLHEITIKVARAEDVPAVAAAVKQVMERNHKKKDYEIIVPLELIQRAERTKQIFTIVLGSIAAISLLVGGIGIMNIMLATVTERTREIGIRRALGAKRRDIITQFLVETAMLAAAGGGIGVALGLVIPYFVSRFAGMPTIVTLWSPLLAFGISAMVGVLFGIYPARRAARMDPVEALRHE
jgi:putative ABC transport system permease protein